MSSTNPPAGSQPPNPQDSAYPPPAGAPPAATPAGQAPYGSPGLPNAYPAPGQPPYPYGAYTPPPGTLGYYPPPQAPSQFYPPPGQYPYQYPGYYPPPGQYPPPPGQYPPPGGQYPPPATGATPGAPATGTPPASAHPQYAPPAGAPPAGQYPPPPPAGQYPPPAGSPYGAAQPGYSPYGMQGYPPSGGPVYPAPMHHQDPLIYLGTAIPDPTAPPAAHGVQKVQGYDPALDYDQIVRATANNVADESQRQSTSSSLTMASSTKRRLSLSSRRTSSLIRSESSENEPPSPSLPVEYIAFYTPKKPSHTTSAMASAYHSMTSRAANTLTLKTNYTVAVLKVLTNLDVFQMNALNDYFTAKQGITLTDRVEKSTTGNFGIAARALTLGPLGHDVDLARKALIGFGTNETILIELVLGRPGHEIRWLKTAYKSRYGKDLVDDVKSDLSGKTERMFIMALSTQKPVDGPFNPIDFTRVASDVEALNTAAKKKEEIPFFEILINRSDQHIAAVITNFGTRYKSLSKVIKKAFNGTIEQGLLYIVHGVKPKRDQQGIWRDAKLLEKSMAGLGTKDQQLIYRLIRAYWNPQRLLAIKDAYKRRYGKELDNRVKGETSGVYRDLLLALLKSSNATQAPQVPPK